MSRKCKLSLPRQILRGCSQCVFQANELTGLMLLIAVAVFNWKMAALFVIGVGVGTLTARVVKGTGELADLGVYGFNSGLVGMAMGSFFHVTPAIWLWTVVFAALAGVIAVLLSKTLPFPFLASPFIMVFWIVWLLQERLDIAPVELGAFPRVPVDWGKSVVAAVGSALFIPTLLSGSILLGGIALSNWRHALIALMGAFVANALAAQAGSAGGAINFGFTGFNGVLAALAAYVMVTPDLRLVVLAAVLSTWFASYIYRGTSVPVLASGFVLSIWFIIFLNWLNPWFAGGSQRAKAGAL